MRTEPQIGPRFWPGFLKTLPPLRNVTYVVFFAAGMISALWAGLIPSLKSALNVDEGVLGTMLLGLGIGSLVMMPVTGRLVARWGCRAVLRTSLPLMAVFIVTLAFTTNVWLAAALVILFGGALGVTDVSMNVQSVVAEKREKRAILSGFHAAYSFGGMSGGFFFAALVGIGLPVWAAVLMGVVLIVAVATAWSPWSLGPGETEDDGGKTEEKHEKSSKKPLILYVTAFFCFAFFLTEGSLLDWSALYLAAALGYSVFSAAMTIGRTFGDRIIARFGRRRVFLTGTLCAILGYAVLLTIPGLWSAYAALFVMGIGCSNLVPIAFWLAGNCPGVSVSKGLAFVVSTGYAGILAGPAAIGFIARHSGLDTAFLMVALMTTVVLVMSLKVFPKD